MQNPPLNIAIRPAPPARLSAAGLLLGLVGLVVVTLAVTPAVGRGEGILASMELPEGIVPAAPPERFGPQTLFEIIDGEADLYLKAGFLALETRTFHLEGESEQWIDLLAYRMDSHRSAFAVFSVRRGLETLPLEMTAFAYRYGDGLFFVHGPFYVEMRSAQTSDTLSAAMTTLAEAFVDGHPLEETPIPELALLPPEQRVPRSATLYPAGAFGFDGFDALFTARYRLEGGEATAYFHPSASPEAAARLADDYQTFLLSYGGALEPLAAGPPGGWLMRVMDRYVLVFTAGSFLGGVHEAPNPELAAILARRLYERLAAAGS